MRRACALTAPSPKSLRPSQPHIHTLASSHSCTHNLTLLLTHCHTVTITLVVFLSRKRKAKKTRETRKKTQPVPSDLFEKLSQLDKKDMAEKESREGAKGEENVVREQVERERKEFVEQLRTSPKDTVMVQ